MWGNAGRYLRRSDSSSCSSSDPSSSSLEDEDGSLDALAAASPSLPAAIHITRRSPSFGVAHNVSHNVAHIKTAKKARDISKLQSFWEEQARCVNALYPPAVWSVLHSVLDQSKVTQNKVLQAVIPILNKAEQHLWPKTRQQIDVKLKAASLRTLAVTPDGRYNLLLTDVIVTLLTDVMVTLLTDVLPYVLRTSFTPYGPFFDVRTDLVLTSVRTFFRTSVRRNVRKA